MTLIMRYRGATLCVTCRMIIKCHATCSTEPYSSISATLFLKLPLVLVCFLLFPFPVSTSARNSLKIILHVTLYLWPGGKKEGRKEGKKEEKEGGRKDRWT